MRTRLYSLDELDDIPGTTVFNAHAQPPGLSPAQVLHVADAGREPRGVPRRRARLSRPLPDERRAEAGGARARLHQADRPRRQHLFPRQAVEHRRLDHAEGGQLDDQHDPRRIRRDDARRRPLARRPALDPRARSNGADHRGHRHQPRPRDRRRVRPGARPGRILEAGVRRLRMGQGVRGARGPRRRHPVLQRPRQRDDARRRADVRARHGRGVRRRRRGLGPPPGADGDGRSGARRAPRRAAGDRRVRPHADEHARRRPRPHRPALADVRQVRGMAGAGDPAGGQRDPVPDPFGRALLAARRGDRRRGARPIPRASTCRSGAPAG